MVVLRSKISIVLAPKVLDRLDGIATVNNTKSTGVLTLVIEELFRDKKQLVALLQEIGMTIGEDFDKPDEIELPFECKKVVIPDKCPACGESEDILGGKVLYEADGEMCCKACYAKFKPEMR